LRYPSPAPTSRAPAAQLVHERHVLGEAERVLERPSRIAEAIRIVRVRSAIAASAGNTEARYVGTVMLGRSHRREPELLGRLDLLEVLPIQSAVGAVPARRVAEVVPDPELHRM